MEVLNIVDHQKERAFLFLIGIEFREVIEVERRDGGRVLAMLEK